MKKSPPTAIAALALLLAASPSAPAAADAPAWIRRDSWFESMAASHDALTAQSRTADDFKAAIEKVCRQAAETFADPVPHRECLIEHRAGIWQGDWKAGDWKAWAGRYAEAAGPAAARARELADNCNDLAGVQAVRGLFYVQYAARRIELARQSLELVELLAPRPQLAAQLRDLTAGLADAGEGKLSGEVLYAKACDLRRRIIFSHPGLDFPQLLINKRSGFLPEHMCDQYLGRHSQAAPGLVVLDNWKQQARETLLLDGKLPKGGLLQPALSFDGRRVAFAFAGQATTNERSRWGYSLYEYSFDNGELRRITGTPSDPLVGQEGRETVLIEDTAPSYLPDGGLAFISTRSQQYGRCHGSRFVPSYTLYRCELDGSGIRPLSFNESNEWAPSVLSDGSIIYCRWDYVNRHDTIFQSLWTIRPDGTQTAHYYGNNSRSPCMISEAKAIPGSQRTVSTACAHHGQSIGTLVTVDPWKGQEGAAPLTWITPEIAFPEAGTPDGIAQSARPLDEDIGHELRASTPWPIDENLFLCTYRQDGQYAIYLVDTLGGRELIHRDAAISCFDPIPLRPRPRPPALPSTIAADPGAATGVFSVTDVYASTQPIPRGTVKQLRINRIISQPTRAAPPRSHVNNELVKQVLGTVPVNDDGSVAFEAPACAPLQFQLLDAEGMAVMTMRSLVYLQPGETAACVGCHEDRYSTPPLMSSRPPAVRKITPPAGPPGTGGLSYMRSVQPVLDRYCVGCHGPDDPPRGIDLAGGYERRDAEGRILPRSMGEFSVSYESLLKVPGMVPVAQRFAETTFSKPMDYFARAGKLAPMLLAGHPDKDGAKRLQLDAASFQRIVDWLDLNAQFYGDYSFNRLERRRPNGEGETALRKAVAERFGEATAMLPYAMLVNVANPGESPILMGPLPAAAGGWGNLPSNAFAGADDPALLEMRRLVESSIEPLQWRDVAGTCGRDENCACGNCWVRGNLVTRRRNGDQ